jgi:hypothetical protein
MLCSVKGSVHGSITDLIMPKKRRKFHAIKLRVTGIRNPNPKRKTPQLRDRTRLTLLSIPCGTHSKHQSALFSKQYNSMKRDAASTQQVRVTASSVNTPRQSQ